MEQSNFFIAPYSYIQIWLLDPKTLNLNEKRRVTENKKLFNSDNRTIDVTRSVETAVLSKRVVELVELTVRQAVKDT